MNPEPGALDQHATNTDDTPVPAIDGLQDLDQEPVTEDDAAAEIAAGADQ